MKCPHCGQEVLDGTLVCPWCHQDISATQRFEPIKPRWCSLCGALVGEGQTVCAKCGTVLAGEKASRQVRRVRALNLPSIDQHESSNKHGADHSRVESAIPSSEDHRSAQHVRHERLPRVRVFVIASLAALIIVGGSIIALTQMYSSARQRSTDAGADLSMTGYPGRLESLSAQDRSAQEDVVKKTAHQAPKEVSLSDAYELLLAYHTQLTNSTKALVNDLLGMLAEDMETQAVQIESLSQRLFAFTQYYQSCAQTTDITDNSENTTSGATSNSTSAANGDRSSDSTITSEDARVMAELYGYLSDWSVALLQGWQYAVESLDVSQDYTNITHSITSLQNNDGIVSYSQQFLDNYEAKKPQSL